MKLLLQDLVSQFVGGQISHKSKEWVKLTSDTFILQIVSGVHIPFIQVPVQYNPLKNPKFNA